MKRITPYLMQIDSEETAELLAIYIPRAALDVGAYIRIDLEKTADGWKQTYRGLDDETQTAHESQKEPEFVP